MFKPRYHIWYVSPITLRILAVNISALVILVLGLLYTGQYEKEMINSGLAALQTEGRLLTAALAESGVRETLEGDPVLVEDLSRQMLRKLVESGTFHTVLFNKGGQLLLDSRLLTGPGGMVQMAELDAPFESWSFKEKITYYFHAPLKLLPTRLVLPDYPEKTEGVETWPYMTDALKGTSTGAAWHDAGGRLVLTVSLPVQNLKNVLGAVMLIRSGSDIEQAMRDVQTAVLELFLWALLTTVLLSIYLSETIGTPILRLAAATEKVREGFLLKDSIPDFAYRHDEIGVLSTALRNMTSDLAERIDTISNFAADVAHEIKNPLASLKSAVETFAVVKDPERQQKLVSIIEDDVSRLNRLITDISMASRLDAELSRAEKTTFDVADLLRHAAPPEEGRITLLLKKDRKLRVVGNAEQLGQVLHNLLQNALSFIATKGKITVTGFARKGNVIVYVDNDGPAIPEKNIETIFERFYSERPEEKKFGLHSGLGLSISRQIVRAHGGVLFATNLKNEKGQHQGVRFTIILAAG